MKFYDGWGNRPKSHPEINSGIELIDVATYVPAKKQIESLMAAGRRLMAARIEQYEFEHPEGIPDDYYDITSARNADIVDVHFFADRLRTKLDRQKKQKEASEKNSKQSAPAAAEKSSASTEIPPSK